MAHRSIFQNHETALCGQSLHLQTITSGVAVVLYLLAILLAEPLGEETTAPLDWRRAAHTAAETFFCSLLMDWHQCELKRLN